MVRQQRERMGDIVGHRIYGARNVVFACVAVVEVLMKGLGPHQVGWGARRGSGAFLLPVDHRLIVRSIGNGALSDIKVLCCHIFGHNTRGSRSDLVMSPWELRSDARCLKMSDGKCACQMIWGELRSAQLEGGDRDCSARCLAFTIGDGGSAWKGSACCEPNSSHAKTRSVTGTKEFRLGLRHNFE
jgi:hypothetical protein